jgi:hypothetical protein
VTTGVVVVVVGDTVSLFPDEPDVVDGVVVALDVDDPEEAPEAPLTPECSLDTATPINAVAPVATRIAVRVKTRTRECAR